MTIFRELPSFQHGILNHYVLSPVHRPEWEGKQNSSISLISFFNMQVSEQVAVTFRGSKWLLIWPKFVLIWLSYSVLWKKSENATSGNWSDVAREIAWCDLLLAPTPMDPGACIPSCFLFFPSVRKTNKNFGHIHTTYESHFKKSF